MEYVEELLRNIAPEMEICRYDGQRKYDAVIASGSDDTGRHLRALFDGTPSIIRGSRSSAALLTGRETPAELEGLQDDMFRYSGLGCRNVSLLLVPQETDMAGLCNSIAAPHRTVNPKYRNNYRSLRGKLVAAGTRFIDAGYFIATAGDSFPAATSNIVFHRYDSEEEAYAWIAAHDQSLQCVVGHDVHHPRAVRFGEAQQPRPWDYPDGIDVMEFLLRL